MNASATSPTLLNVSLVTITFKSPLFFTFQNSPHTALNTLLNNITDAAENSSGSSSRLTQFTTWSPCSQNPKTVVILTTASEVVTNPASPIFEPVLKYLSGPPTVQHVYFDWSIISLARSTPDSRVAVDLILMRAPNSGIAGVIGKRFGWDPKRSSLSAQFESHAPAGFSRPGDLVRDFWAWAELHQPGEPVSPSSSLGSEYEREIVLKSTNSDEKNMALDFPEEKDDEEETLVMMFEWSSPADADRFKHPLQKSFGLNGQEVQSDLWDRNVAHPVRQFQGIGAKVESFKLELRGVEPRIEVVRKEKETRERSGSRRLSGLATGFGERVSGFWR